VVALPMAVRSKCICVCGLVCIESIYMGISKVRVYTTGESTINRWIKGGEQNLPLRYKRPATGQIPSAL
jgi:hypothetical protein